MKKIYTNENNFLVHNIKNLVEAQGIKVFIKNEFAQGAIGEVAVFDAWPELWVVDDNEFDKAVEVVNSAKSSMSVKDWTCPNCTEVNGGSFEICWNCQYEKQSN